MLFCVLVAVVVVCLSSLLLETFSSYDGNAKEDVDLKMHLYLLSEFRKLVDMINIPNSTASKPQHSYENSVEFQMET